MYIGTFNIYFISTFKDDHIFNRDYKYTILLYISAHIRT